MRRTTLEYFFIIVFLVLSKNTISQPLFSLSSDTMGDIEMVRLGGKFIINDKIGLGTYTIFQIVPIDTVEMDPWMYSIAFGNNPETIKKYTFSLITCKEHDVDFNNDFIVGDTLDIKARTPDGSWFLYGCFHDENARQPLTLPCGCKRSVPLYIIKTQLLIIDQTNKE